jgi:hypothetical protein
VVRVEAVSVSERVVVEDECELGVVMVAEEDG